MTPTTYPRTFPTSTPINLSIRSRSGSVRVTAADVTEASVDVQPARSGDERAAQVIDDASVEQDEDSLNIEVPRAGTWPSLSPDAAIDIRVTVPLRSTLKVKTGSADVHASGRLGSASLETGSGDVAVIGCTDALAKTGSGDVYVDDVATVDARTGSGGVNVERCSGRINVHTASGDARVAQMSDRGDVRTASGDIEIGTVEGDVKTKAASGDIHVQRAVEGAVEASTASGDVTIRVVSGTAAKLDCSSVSGRIRSDLEGTEAPADTDRTVFVSARAVSGSVTVTRST